MKTQYEHTQFGYLISIAMSATIILLGYLLATAGFNWIGLVVMAIIVACLVLFSTLTVIIRQGILEVKFGPGLIKKRFSLRDIESSRPVRNSWFYGWGIRVTPHGLLYNVSGLDAVEIKLRNGSKFRIGTDVPAELDNAIRSAISPPKDWK